MIKIQDLEPLGFKLTEDIEDEYTSYNWTHDTKDIQVEVTFDWTKPKGEPRELVEIGMGLIWETLHINTTQRLQTLMGILTAK